MTEIRRLFDCGWALTTLAAAYEREWPDWYRPETEAALADLRRRARSRGMPFGLVAVTEGRAIGTCALVEDGPQPSTLTPWLGGLWVDPAERRRGVAAALALNAMSEARQQGFERLYAASIDADGFFRRLGWRALAPWRHDDATLHLFEANTGLGD
jgi:GNAT superfamily N-acetyltransferase